MNKYQEQSMLLQLPKELRLTIYEYVLATNPIIYVGNRNINEQSLVAWPTQPSICRTCRLLRSESLAMYYSFCTLHLNIQRPSGEYMVSNWLVRLALSIPESLNKIRVVSVLAGLGYSEPPKEYKVDVQRPAFISATRPCAAAYLYTRRSYNMRSWSHLVSGALKRRIAIMPGNGSPDFSVAKNIRVVLATVGELSGCGLDGDIATLVDGITMPMERERSNCQDFSTLFKLPKELRIAIYEEAFISVSPITIGQSSLRDRLFLSPGLLRTCSIVRREALPIYFSSTHFILNIQRILCEEAVLKWIRHCTLKYPESFQHINHVSIIAGSGLRQPPRQYEFSIQQNLLVSTIDRRVMQPYTLPASRWYPPPWALLKRELARLPKRGEMNYDAAHDLRRIVDVLARSSDLDWRASSQ